MADTTSEIEKEMERIGADNWRASTASGGAYTKSSGLPKYNANPDDPSFVLRWQEGEEKFAVACDAYTSLSANVRAVYLWVNETRMRAQRKVVTGESEFAAARLPSGDDDDAVVVQQPPHEVLDVAPDASDEVVAAAKRAKMKTVHPDQGGSVEEKMRVERAAERLLSE